MFELQNAYKELMTIARIVYGDSFKAPIPKRDKSNPLNPDGREMRRMEREGKKVIASALDKWRRATFKGLDRKSNSLAEAQKISTQMNDNIHLFQDAVTDWIVGVAVNGVEFGIKQIEARVLGVKQDVGIDWTLANEKAVDFALNYGANLAQIVNKNTRKIVDRYIADYIANQQTIGDLINRILANSNTFSLKRAERIAVTGVTRIFAQSNLIAWGQSGVVEGKEWVTNNDELVCPFCAPLNGQIVELNDNFINDKTGTEYNSPDAHEFCRCWIVPVVAND